MKKTFFLLPGAIALLLSATPMVTVNAQTPAPAAPRAGQRMQNKLNLTAEQKARMKTIRENTRSQIDGILTAEQRSQLEAQKGQRGQGQRGQGMKRGQGWQALNLTEDQKARIKTIMQSSHQEMEGVLTPAQLEQMRQFRAQRRSNKPAQ